jgi:hypothetical protein
MTPWQTVHPDCLNSVTVSLHHQCSLSLMLSLSHHLEMFRVLRPSLLWHHTGDVSHRQAKSKTSKLASTKENLYILASGACVCGTAADDTRMSKREQLKEGDMFGATRYLFERIPEIACLCPMLLQWTPHASVVTAVTQCTLACLSLSDEDPTGLTGGLMEAIKSYVKLAHRALQRCSPLAHISCGERQWVLGMAQLVSYPNTSVERKRQNKALAVPQSATSPRSSSGSNRLSAMQLNGAQISQGAAERQVLIMVSAELGQETQSQVAVTRIEHLYPDPMLACRGEGPRRLLLPSPLACLTSLAAHNEAKRKPSGARGLRTSPGRRGERGDGKDSGGGGGGGDSMEGLWGEREEGSCDWACDSSLLSDFRVLMKGLDEVKRLQEQRRETIEAFDRTSQSNDSHRLQGGGGGKGRPTGADGQDKHAAEHRGPQHAMLEQVRRSSRHQLGLQSLQEGSLLGIRDALLARHLRATSAPGCSGGGGHGRCAGARAGAGAGAGLLEGREEERWEILGGAVYGIRVPAAPLLSLLAAGDNGAGLYWEDDTKGTGLYKDDKGAGLHKEDKSAILYRDCLRAVHFDLCAVALARQQFEWFFLVREHLRTLHERVTNMVEFFIMPLRGMSHSLITPADHARLSGCLPMVREQVAGLLRRVERVTLALSSCSMLSAHRLQEAVMDAVIHIASVSLIMARYAALVHMQTLTLRSLTRNQLLHCFIGQIEVQQSRSLAKQLQLPVSIWPLIIHATQRLFCSFPCSQRSLVRRGAFQKGRQRAGAAQTEPARQRSLAQILDCDLSEDDPDEDSDGEEWQNEEAEAEAEGEGGKEVVGAEGLSAPEWCSVLEQCFRESCDARGSCWQGLGDAGGGGGGGRGDGGCGLICDCVGRMCGVGRREMARRWNQAQMLKKEGKEREEQRERARQFARHEQLLLARFRNGELSSSEVQESSHINCYYLNKL